MRQNDEARAAAAEHPATAKVAPRFTRAAQAERLRLAGKREQLLRKREAAQAEVGRIDRAVGAVDELLELLAPLISGNGSEPGPTGDGGNPGAEQGASGSEGGLADERDRAQPPDQPQPAKE